MSHVRVFISYAWEDDSYRDRVKRFAARLRSDGVDARLDAWAPGGVSIPEFMAREVRNADRILILCSPAYRRKVHAMEDGQIVTGGGWEQLLITSVIWAGIKNLNQVDVVLFRGTWLDSAPTFLSGFAYIDLTDELRFETCYRDLLRRLHNRNESAPLIGHAPLDLDPPPVEPLRGQRRSVVNPRPEPRPELRIDPHKSYTADLQTSRGPLRFRLLAASVPVLVNNFIYLALRQHYDGTRFHRVLPNLLIQGGDRAGTGEGYPGYWLPDDYGGGSHEAGSLSLANTGPHTNASQFFITLTEALWLDGKYCRIGQLEAEYQRTASSITHDDIVESIQIHSDGQPLHGWRSVVRHWENLDQDRAAELSKLADERTSLKTTARQVRTLPKPMLQESNVSRMSRESTADIWGHHKYRVLEYFLNDETDGATLLQINEYLSHSLQEAAYIQSVGMNEPVPLMHLYQPTRLKTGPEPDVASAIARSQNSVIYAGPGQGKTTLLKYLLLALAGDQAYLPLLFTLRTQGALQCLERVIELLDVQRRFHRIPHTPFTLILLIDGYDEVGEEQQQQVSRLMGKYAGLRLGSIMLSCRSGYEVKGTPTCDYELADFNRDDAISFVDAFAKGLRASIKGKQLIGELEERKLTYILSHPLMLTLACVVKTRANPQLPHNSIELMRLAIETLSFRWDETKALARASAVGLSSVQISDCVTRLAYDMKDLKVPMVNVLAHIGQYLALMRRPEILPERVFTEIRRFYGLLITTPDGRCQFVHKTVQDYLSARYQVERGLFDPTRVVDWDLRAAFCACLSYDATRSIKEALFHSPSIEAVRECLLNNAAFDPHDVSGRVFEHFDRFPGNHVIVSVGSPPNFRISSKSDFMSVCDNVFLRAIMIKGHNATRHAACQVVWGLCISECFSRKLGFSAEDVNAIQAMFGSLKATLTVWRSGVEHRFILSEAVIIDPHL